MQRLTLAAIATMATMATMAVPHAASADDPWRTAHKSVTRENFDDGGDVSRQFHLNAGAYLNMATVEHTSSADPLRLRLDNPLPRFTVRHDGGTSTLTEYVAENPYVDGMIVLYDGAVIFEAYPRMQPWQRHFAWSVSKVIAATAVAALVESGNVDPEKPIADYVPDLADTAWADIRVRDIANMASGIDCLDDDGYEDPSTCVYRLEETLGITAPAGYETGFIGHMQAMESHREPNTKNEYVSANTQALMLIVEAVTGQSYAAALRDLIWTPIGAEADALIPVNEEAYAHALGGVTARLRDIARFGLVFVNPDGAGIISRDLVADMQGDSGIALADDEDLVELFGDDLPVRAAWQWDYVWEDGAMFKSGYLGQGLYVDPARSLVMAWFGTGDDHNETRHELLPIARQIATSGRY